MARTSLNFPTFLINSAPFRRTSASSSSHSEPPAGVTNVNETSSVETHPSPPTKISLQYLDSHTSSSLLRCQRCSAELCLTSQIISKGFTGRHGRAYLISGPADSSASASGNVRMHGSSSSTLPNTITHAPVPRHLVTGAHTVSDISCALCGAALGWKYVAAEDEAQRYKVGKFILETRRVRTARCWESAGSLDASGSSKNSTSEEETDGDGNIVEIGPTPPPHDDETADVVFDSQDEDECEDLFAGVWSPRLALKRRRGKRFNTRSGGELEHDLGTANGGIHA
ncbi:MAG: hypothetical protein M1825_003881 [Sarcosagium campestre]|nr:MAG: hypothetical protein M1825_003881 [Sarcosagium campestre]